MNRKNVISYSLIGLLIVAFFVAGLLLRPNQSTVDEPIVNSSDQEVVIYFFWGEGCPYCQTEKAFLDGIKDDFPSLVINDYEVYYNEENRNMFLEMAAAYGIDNPQGVPMTFINDQYFIGFAEDPIGLEIISLINGCLDSVCLNPITRLN
jgi:thiol-disulfide isomerase/thioredoxin